MTVMEDRSGGPLQDKLKCQRVPAATRVCQRAAVASSGRFEEVFSLGAGLEILPWLRRHGEGRAVRAAVGPVACASAQLVEHYRWPEVRAGLRHSAAPEVGGAVWRDLTCRRRGPCARTGVLACVF